MKRAVWLLLLCLALSACRRDPGPVDLDALAGQARGGDNKAVKQLVALLAVNENQLNDRAHKILLELGATVQPLLLEQLDTPNKFQREHIVALLGSFKARDAIPALGRILATPTLERRYIAAWALGEIGEADGVAPLLKALDDEDAEVRKYATRSLIKLNQAAVAPLLDALRSATPRAGGGMIRVLGDIADPRSLEPLLAQVHGPNREEVFLALGKLKDPRAEQTLLTGLSDGDWKVRMNAAMALGPLASQAAVPLLRRTLEDEVHVVREWSARSLEMITGEHIKYRNEQGEYVAPYAIYH